MSASAICGRSNFQTRDGQQQTLRNQIPVLRVGNDDSRPGVKVYETEPKYRVGDKVYLKVSDGQEGPYIVASAPTTGKYTLCLEDGQLVKNGDDVEESDLKAAE